MAEEVMNEIPVMREMEHPRETHLLARGQYDAATDAKECAKVLFHIQAKAFES